MEKKISRETHGTFTQETEGAGGKKRGEATQSRGEAGQKRYCVFFVEQFWGLLKFNAPTGDFYCHAEHITGPDVMARHFR